MREFAAVEWDRAKRSLDSTRRLVEVDPNSAASRAYYAAFHALTALFAIRGQSFSKHSAIRAALHRELVHSGILKKASGKDYDFLMDLRETGDYGGVTQVSGDSARLALEKVERFLAEAAEACPELKDLPAGS